MKSAPTLRDLRHATNLASFGGKATNLARLAYQAVPVPAGRVLSTEHFEKHLFRCGLPSSSEIYDQLISLTKPLAQQQAATAMKRVLDTPLDADLIGAVRTGLSELGPDLVMAVRSSATGEDAAEASFAGMFDTYLNVVGLDDMICAIRKVWASFFSERVLAYARHKSMKPGAMAVILQCQVDAVFSGVMFTADPTPRCGDRGLLIEYCDGLGEQLVSGEIHPSSIRMSYETGQLTWESGDARIQRLPVEFVRALRDAATELESLFGCPQDVEWSIDAAGQLLLLQSRPITNQGTQGPLHFWTNANIAENYPAPIAPLLRSFIARGFGAYFRSLGVAFGISRSRTLQMDAELDGLIGVHAGRPYYNLSHIHSAIGLAPCGSWLAGFFNQFVGSEGRPTLAQGKTSRLLEVASLGKVAIRVVYSYAGMRWRLRRFEKQVDTYAADTAPRMLRKATPGELAVRLNGFMNIRLHEWTGAAMADAAAMVCYGMLSYLLKRWLPQYDQQSMQNDLLKGLPGLASAIPVEKLWDLSRQVRLDPTLHKAFAGHDTEVWMRELRTGKHAAFWSEFQVYIEQWGFRYSGELMLTQPTPHEDPKPVLKVLQTYVHRDGPGPREISEVQAQERRHVTRQLWCELRGGWSLTGLLKGVAFMFALKGTQAAVRWRERARLKQALLYTRLRHVALRLGHWLLQEKMLADPEDVFYLEFDELLELVRSRQLPSGSVADCVALRKAEESEWVRQTPPDNFRLSPGESWSPAHVQETMEIDESDDVLVGSGACGGVAEGRVLVALDVSDAEELQPGQILVTRQTDPGWAGVFFLIKGLVIERGGMLSHGAIIAREYGIPAVVGVKRATSIISTGQLVRVDGNRGQVTFGAA